ncbi:MAG: sugar ABC transporter permease [Oscillospiraceae bacterium]|nr:sugar ABC transporter permease [Oscillospiraceae bacterium]
MSRALVRRETISGYLFMLPSLIFFVGFVIIPMILCIYTSFFDANLTANGQDTFIGFGNYIELFQDSIFLKALLNTVIIVVVSVPVTCVFSLWVSSVIYRLRGSLLSAFRCIFYLPVVTGSVAVTVVWKSIYNYRNGVLKELLNINGILDSNVNWLGNPSTALACIIVILLTTSVGQPIVLYVSALGNVDTTLYILVITTINSFQCFALIQLLTSGGPVNSTNTVMYYIYYSAFKLYRLGYGNAMGVILAIFIALLSALQFRLAREK